MYRKQSDYSYDVSQYIQEVSDNFEVLMEFKN